ncbi:hypothetical protein C0995_000229 [Termitomyces sp. Mi166|nr:hypothetical protein C0995_000229 [Termitomyces sp. Mi166\
MEIWRELRRPHSTLRPASVSHFRHYSGLTPPAPAIPAARFPAPGNPYGRGRCPTTPSGPAVVPKMQEIQALCKALSSGARAEQEELLLQLLVAKDAAGAPSLNDPMLELTLGEANGCSSPPELEGDF